MRELVFFYTQNENLYWSAKKSVEKIKKVNILACMKIVQKTFSYCLKPTTPQKSLFACYAGCARFVYNYGLGLIKKAFEQKTSIPTYEDIANLLPQLKEAPNTKWLKEVHSQILQQSIKDLAKALKMFFRSKNEKQRWGFPKFKRKGVNDSFRFPQNVVCANGKVYLPKIGWVSYFDSQPIVGIIKQAVVKRQGERWFVHIACDIEIDVPMKQINPNKAIGIDLGLLQFATLSNCEVIENPRFFKESLDRLRFLSRGHSRKQKGSKNSKKSAAKLGKTPS